MSAKEVVRINKLVYLKEKEIKTKNEILNDPYNLRFASEELRDDEELVKKIVKDCGLAIEFASDRLLNNFDVAMLAVKNNGLALAFLSDKLKDKSEIVLAAVKQNGKALMFASARLREQERVVFKAMENYSGSLKYANKRFKNNQEYVLSSVKGQERYSFMDIDKIWFKDHDFMAKASEISAKILSKYDRSVLTREIILDYISKDGLNLQYFDDFNNDFEIVKNAVNQNGMALKFASPFLRDNVEIALLAITKNSESIKFIGQNVKNYLLSK